MLEELIFKSAKSKLFVQKDSGLTQGFPNIKRKMKCAGFVYALLAIADEDGRHLSKA